MLILKLYFLSLVIFLTGCSAFYKGQATATPVTKITLEESQKIARNIGIQGGFDIQSESSDPQIVLTELIPLQDAYRRYGFALAPGDDPKLLVWHIRLQGIWRDAFPRPEGSPTSEPQQFLIVIIDSQNGGVLSVSTSNT